jgi:hypothetical protein
MWQIRPASWQALAKFQVCDKVCDRISYRTLEKLTSAWLFSLRPTSPVTAGWADMRGGEFHHQNLLAQYRNCQVVWAAALRIVRSSRD